jgi:hypothetical protein
MSATAAEPPPFESISSVHTTATSAAETAGPRAGVDRSLSDTGIKVEAEAGSGAKEISDDEAASQDEPSPCPSSFRDQVEWLSKVRTGLEYSVCIAAYRVDSLFGNRDEAELDEARAVYGRLRLGTYWDGYDGFDPELRLRASYPLPSVKQRARAIIGRGTDEELIEGAPREIDSGGLFSDEEDVNWLVGLGYNRIRSRNSRLDFGAGLKLESPLNPYLKATYRYRFLVAEDVMLRFQQVAFWENVDGFGTSTLADAEWLLNEKQLLRWSNYLKIDETTDGVAWNSNVTLYQRLAQAKAVAFRALVRGATDREISPTKYQLEVIYRQRFIHDWLFIELHGGGGWIRKDTDPSREFYPEFGLIFEIVFGDHPNLAR